jgi:hypothetical protein
MNKKTITALAILCIAMSVASATKAQSLNTNLLVNPGAEQGLTGWVPNPLTSAGQTPMPISVNYVAFSSPIVPSYPATSCPIFPVTSTLIVPPQNLGSRLFVATVGVSAGANQTIQITNPATIALIDTGTVKIKFSGLTGG